MLPSPILSEEGFGPLPWASSTEDAWYQALGAMIRDMTPVQSTGAFRRGKETQIVRPRKSKTKPRLSICPARFHLPMFRRPRSSPGFWIPGRDVLRELAGRPMLEVGAGSGLVSMLVAAAGGDIIATDPRPWPIGWAYDHRDMPWDRSFAERHLRTRRRPSMFQPIRHSERWWGHGQPRWFVVSRAGPARMSFTRIWRQPYPLRQLPTYFPIEILSAEDAIHAYPDRDVLLISPDPANAKWLYDLLPSIRPGRRLFVHYEMARTFRMPQRMTGWRHLQDMDGASYFNGCPMTCSVFLRETS